MDETTAQDLAETIADEVFKVGHSVEFAKRMDLGVVRLAAARELLHAYLFSLNPNRHYAKQEIPARPLPLKMPAAVFVLDPFASCPGFESNHLALQ